jgi:predicted nuclease of predicted toxin-antitoxin system
VIIWIDAQLSPALAPWLTTEFGIEAFSVRFLHMVRSKDLEIYQAARDANVAVLTKDSDFILLQERLGPPPSLLWVRCGNTSNAHLKHVFRRTFAAAYALVEAGEPLVEITDLP